MSANDEEKQKLTGAEEREVRLEQERLEAERIAKEKAEEAPVTHL